MRVFSTPRPIVSGCSRRTYESTNPHVYQYYKPEGQRGTALSRLGAQNIVSKSPKLSCAFPWTTSLKDVSLILENPPQNLVVSV